GGDQADAVLAGHLDPGLAARRRPGLYAGHGVLPPRVDPLFARDLAPVRDRRQRLPLRGGRLPRGGTAHARRLIRRGYSRALHGRCRYWPHGSNHVPLTPAGPAPLAAVPPLAAAGDRAVRPGPDDRGAVDPVRLELV